MGKDRAKLKLKTLKLGEYLRAGSYRTCREHMYWRAGSPHTVLFLEYLRAGTLSHAENCLPSSTSYEPQVQNTACPQVLSSPRVFFA